MERRRMQIPTGMQDTLPGECARKRLLETQLRELFCLGGYQEIETPILEYYDALDDPTYGYRPELVWKTFDSKGRILALRPDSTIPAVRLAAGRLKEENLPLRLCYVQSATQFESDTLSLLCEETQAGVELMGEASPQADAEVIALAIDALKAAGLKDFQIELGHAGFFAGFMQEAGLTESQCAVMRELTEQKNALGMQLYLHKLSVNKDVTRRLMRLPQLYGDATVLEEAAALTNHALCRASLASLKEIIDILKEYGCEKYLSVDLGMVHQANYYSGVIFRGMTADLGQPLLSGGRYDGLPARFGRAMPATGFAVSLKKVLIALERQGAAFHPPVPQMMIGFDAQAMGEAIAYARQMRAQGVSAAMAYGATRGEMVQKAAQGLTQQAVYITREGMTFYPAKEDAPCRK